MRFTSTEGRAPATTFRNAVFSGLAPDGGLYIPERLPLMPPETVRGLASGSLHSVGQEFLSAFIDDIARGELSAILLRAWTFPIPLVHLEENLFLLELHHGPTWPSRTWALTQTLSFYLQASDRTWPFLLRHR
jgi:threonine synthase